MCSVEKMQNMLANKDQMAALHLCNIQMVEDNKEGTSFLALKVQSFVLTKVVKELLLDFADIFRFSDSLPPERSYDHQITLKDGTQPINQRPY